jgi:hypothetical protein
MWLRQMGLSLSQKILASQSPVIHPMGYPEFPINGLSFYQENVQRAASRMGIADGDNATTQAVLVCEPENPHSKSGTAVAVYLSSYMVGHIPSESSSFFFNLILPVGGIARADARFYFSRDGNSACRLDVGYPPSWEAPIEGIEPDYLDGDGTFSLRMRTAKYPIDWERVRAFNPDIYIEVGESYTGGGYLTQPGYRRSPYLDTDFEEITAKPYEADEAFVNRLLASVGGKAKVEYLLTRTSEKSHKVKLDLDVSKWKNSSRTKTSKPSVSKAVNIAGVNAPKKRRSKKSVWMKMLFGKPRRKKSIWRGLFLGD